MSGLGTRFYQRGFTEAKPLIDVNGQSMIRAVIRNLNFEGANFIFVINKTQISEEDFTDHISDLLDNFIVLSVESVTSGPACSCLLAESYISNSTPLLIVNCDQIIHDFDFSFIQEFSKLREADGLIGCFVSSSPKNSYVLLNDDGRVVQVKEKEVISNLATNGLHYWSNGQDFVTSSKLMIESGDSFNGEFYVAPSFNYLIKNGKKILPFFYNLHFPIGTPEDLEIYRNLTIHGKTQD